MLMCGRKGAIVAPLTAAGLLGWISNPAEAAVQVEGQVQAGGGVVAGSAASLSGAIHERRRQNFHRFR